MKFPIDGIAREPYKAGSGEIPEPTVKVWMGEEGLGVVRLNFVLYWLCLLNPIRIGFFVLQGYM